MEYEEITKGIGEKCTGYTTPYRYEIVVNLKIFGKSFELKLKQKKW